MYCLFIYSLYISVSWLIIDNMHWISNMIVRPQPSNLVIVGFRPSIVDIWSDVNQIPINFIHSAFFGHQGRYTKAMKPKRSKSQHEATKWKQPEGKERRDIFVLVVVLLCKCGCSCCSCCFPASSYLRRPCVLVACSCGCTVKKAQRRKQEQKKQRSEEAKKTEQKNRRMQTSRNTTAKKQRSKTHKEANNTEIWTRETKTANCWNVRANNQRSKRAEKQIIRKTTQKNSRKAEKEQSQKELNKKTSMNGPPEKW